MSSTLNSGVAVSTGATGTFCDQSDVEFIWSSFGVLVRLDDDAGGSADSGVMDWWLEKAAGDVRKCLQPRYSEAVLSDNDWVTKCTAHFAARGIALRRGNGIPEGLQAECDQYRKDLEKMQQGLMHLPADAGGPEAPALDNLPSVSNMVIDGRYKRAKVRRIPSTSTGGNQTTGRQQFNVQETTPYG